MKVGTNIRQRLLQLKMTKNMTSNGKVAQFSAIVATGTQNGGLGIASAKHSEAALAIQKAGKIASKNMEYFKICDSRTIFHDDYVKFKATRLYVRPAAEESGLRCHPVIAEMCSCIGIKDISAQVHGSTHPATVAEAFFRVLQRQKSPEDMAVETGLRLVDVNNLYNYHKEKYHMK